MSSRPLQRPITADEFLRMDLPDWLKAELVEGEIVAMAGGTLRHAEVQLNIATALRTRLRGSGCRPLGSDFAVRTGPDTVRFPDVSVVCGPMDGHSKSTDSPVLVVEVLSPSTARIDRQQKLDEYRELPAVKAIMLVDPDAETVRLIHRPDGDQWIDLMPRGDVDIPQLNLSLPRAEIFARD